MKLINKTVFRAMTFDYWGENGEEVSVVIVKAVLFRQGEKWAYAPGKIDISGVDVFEGDAATGPLQMEQEIAPPKAATDLMIKATAYAPGDTPLTDWPVSIEIPDRLSYGFQVRGPTSWSRRGRSWHRSQPALAQSVPISYTLAYGGAPVGHDGLQHAFEYNPAGRGFIGDAPTKSATEIAAPQIGLLADFMSEKFGEDIAVHGFGPIAKAWLPRRSLAGTLDDKWAQIRHPRMPEDFDPRFWNAAPHPLQISPFLRGNETIRFVNLRPDAPAYSFALPGVSVEGSLFPGSEMVRFNLDTVSIDIEAPAPDDHCVTLIWRAAFPASDSHDALEIAMVAVEELNQG